jgi:hypothetical protein
MRCESASRQRQILDLFLLGTRARTSPSIWASARASTTILRHLQENRFKVPSGRDPYSDCCRLNHKNALAGLAVWRSQANEYFPSLFMPGQAPTLTSRNGIERRTAVEAQSQIEPTLRSRRRSRAGDYRFHLARLAHRQQGKRVGAAASADCTVEALTPLCRFVVGSRVLRT